MVPGTGRQGEGEGEGLTAWWGRKADTLTDAHEREKWWMRETELREACQGAQPSLEPGRNKDKEAFLQEVQQCRIAI